MKNTTWQKRIALFMTGQTISLFGSAMVQFAITWHVTLTTKDGGMIALAALCGFLPQIFISLFAGVWADRFDRKKMIILADSMIAVFTVALAVLFLAGYDRLWLLFAISAVRSIGAGIQTPAVAAYLTELVPQEHLMRINGINATVQSFTFLIAPVIANTAWTLTGIAPLFWIDAVTAVIGIGLLVLIKLPPREKSAVQRPHIFKDMASGLSYVFNTKWLKQFFTFNLLYMLVFAPVVFLTPLMVARSFGEEEWRLMVHEIVFSGGTIIGGVLVGAVSSKIRNKTNLLILFSTMFGLTTLVMGFSQNFWFYLGVMLPMGFTVPFINTSSMTVMQERVDPAYIGRVFGLISITGGVLPLSMAFFGPLADHVSVELQLIVTGGIMVVLSLIFSRFKAMRAAGEPLPKPDAQIEPGAEPEQSEPAIAI